MNSSFYLFIGVGDVDDTGKDSFSTAFVHGVLSLGGMNPTGEEEGKQTEYCGRTEFKNVFVYI